jgi:hypothetical protein
LPGCVICKHLSLPIRTATGTVGLITSQSTIVSFATEHLGREGDEDHVMVPACPEHVVDVYRGRVDGVRMAWRLGDDVAIPRRQSPEAASASRA